MTVLRRLPLLGLLLPLLAACSDEPPVTSSDSVLSSPAWVVTEVFPSEKPHPLLGQKVRLEPGFATDVKGRSCTNPSYDEDSRSAAEFLGNDSDEGESLTVISVQCDGDAFGTYAVAKDGSLLTHEDSLLLRLMSSEKIPLPAATQPKAAAPAVHEEAHAAADGHQEHAAPAAHHAEAHGKLIYLASYRDKASALRGWKELTGVSPILAKAKPELVKVTLPGKGRFIRLHAKGVPAAKAGAVCHEVKGLIPDCGE